MKRKFKYYILQLFYKEAQFPQSDPPKYDVT